MKIYFNTDNTEFGLGHNQSELYQLNTEEFIRDIFYKVEGYKILSKILNCFKQIEIIPPI